MSHRTNSAALARALPLGLALAIAASVAPAAAAPPISDAGHIHHVVIGSGDCVLIDAVAFLAQSRGLHRGASASGVGTGPEHGGC